jgi:hypothetical protein
MRRCIGLVFVAAMIVGTHAAAAEDNPPPPKLLQFTVRIFEGDPLGSPKAGTLTLLADARLTTLENRSASVATGGEILVRDVAKPVEIGLRLDLNPRVVKDGKVCVDLTMSHTAVGEKTNDRTQFHTHTTRTITTIKLGEVVKVRWSDGGADKKSWAELSVDKIQ